MLGQAFTRSVVCSIRYSKRQFSTISIPKAVGVIGSGQMGTGIAFVTALHANLPVKLIDSSNEQLQKSTDFLNSLLQKDLSKKKITSDDVNRVQKLITTSSKLESLIENETNFVIEAVTENLEIKQKIFRSLSELLPNSILASNTSSISLTSIASVVLNPEKVIGMHFMNPVPVMQLVEVIKALQTDDLTLNITIEFAKKLKKVTAQSEDRPGFIANRLLMPYINESFFALQDGIASKEDIDTTMKLGCNMPMGPLTLADFIGLDTCLAIIQVLHRELGEDKYRPAPLLRNYVNAGRLGKKSGKGVFEYQK